jgi:hypothetical protein
MVPSIAEALSNLRIFEIRKTDWSMFIVAMLVSIDFGTIRLDKL